MDDTVFKGRGVEREEAEKEFVYSTIEIQEMK